MSKPIIHEDWAVVWLGFLIIVFSLFIYVVPVPVMGWKNSSELFDKVLTAGNIGVILIQFIFVFAIGILATVLTSKPVDHLSLCSPLSFLVPFWR